MKISAKILYNIPVIFLDCYQPNKQKKRSNFMATKKDPKSAAKKAPAAASKKPAAKPAAKKK